VPPKAKENELIKTHVFLLGLPQSGKSALRQVAFDGKTLDNIKYKETKKPVTLKLKNRTNYIFHDYGGKEQDFEKAVKDAKKISGNERKIIAWILDAANVDSLSKSIKQLKLVQEKLGENDNIKYVLGVSKIDLLNDSQAQLLREQLPPKISIIFSDELIPIVFFSLKDNSYNQFINLLFNIFDDPEIIKSFIPKKKESSSDKKEKEESTKKSLERNKTSLSNKKESIKQASSKKKRKKKIKKTGVRLSTELGIDKKSVNDLELPELEELPSLDGALTPVRLTAEKPSMTKSDEIVSEGADETSQKIASLEDLSDSLPQKSEKITSDILDEIDSILEEVENAIKPTLSDKTKEKDEELLLPPELTITPEQEEEISSYTKILEENIKEEILEEKEKEKENVSEETEIEEIILPKPEEPVFQRLPPPISLSNKDKEEEKIAPETKMPELQVKNITKQLIKEYCEKNNIQYFRVFADFGVIDIEYKPNLEHFSEISNQLIDRFQTTKEEEVLEQNFNGFVLYTIVFPKIMIIVGIPEELSEQFYNELPKTKRFVNELLKQIPFSKVILTEEQINSIPPLHTPKDLDEVSEETITEEIETENEEIQDYPVVSLKNIEKEGTIIIFRKGDEDNKDNNELEFIIAFSSEKDPNHILHVHLPIIKTTILETKETKFFDTEDHTIAIRVGKEYVVVILTKSKYDHNTVIRYLGQILVYLALLRTKRADISFNSLSKDSKLLNLSKTFLSSTLN